MHFLSTNVIKKIKLRGFRMPHTLIRISTDINVQLPSLEIDIVQLTSPSMSYLCHLIVEP